MFKTTYTFNTVGQAILNVIQLYGSIILIVYLIIKLFQRRKNPKDKKILSKIKKSIIILIIILILPILVNTTFKVINDRTTLTECWNHVVKYNK